MNKLFTLSLISCTAALALSINYAQAKEESTKHSIKPESIHKFKHNKVTNNNAAKQLLVNNANPIIDNSSVAKKESATKNPFKQYQVLNHKTDKTGTTHYELQPKVGNVTVSDSVIKIHVNKNDKATMINGDINKPTINVNNKAEISKKDAEQKAFQAIGKSKDQVHNVKGYDIVSKNNLDVNSDKNKYVYNVELNYINPQLAHWKIQVDAQTGKVISKENVLEHASTTGSGIGVNGDVKKPLNLTVNNGQYSLNDTSQHAKMETKNANETTTNFTPITNNTNNFNKSYQRAGVDAHYYANEVYHYYLKTFNRDSYDNRGGKIDSMVHYDKNYNNAAWTGQYMIYGDGDGRTFKPLSGANDVIAHELTHAVTERTARLVYKNQPGALNESFSDVFGYFVDPEDWLMGEDVYTPNIPGDALRSLSNPEKYNQPAHMNQYQRGSQDNGGVHTNSGIPNKAAYLTIKDIGKSKAEQIYYLALTQYLTPNAQFSDAKAALIQASDELYGKNSSESQAVNRAWNNVGL